ncbi:3'-5' oligoribonuclease A [Caloranaerobacter azorensis H53214]|uniref:3'-5' oligoribonuclease A n=2 Tax=Caloranaerobacter azorensis TaxID=116090 RepID=A0A096BI18_9FIRM|nr:3'-5' oligoribonuclease A [Caloranaerobacter azorensis H53214]
MRMKMNDEFKKLKQKLDEVKDICLVSHIHPDGDSIGSLLGFGLALENINKKITMIKVDDIPYKYKFLPQVSKLKNYEENKKFDLLIVLDCSDLDRLGSFKHITENARYIVNIDHHISNTNYGDINIVDHKAAATGELVYNILDYLNMNINKEIATCLYVAIATDTGSFRYDNTHSRTHYIVSKLLEKQIDLKKVTFEVFQNKTLASTKLFIEALNTLELYYDNRLAVVQVTQQMLKKNNAEFNDIDGIVEYIRDIDTVEVACILKEIKEDEIKIGLRSKTYVDVANIAKVFQGGGHIRASGCTIYNNISKAKELIIREIGLNLR